MHIIQYVVISLFCLTVYSCEKDPDCNPSNDVLDVCLFKNFIVFGIVGYECKEDCRKLFLLTENSLHIDADLPIYPFSKTVFEKVALSESYFQIAKPLFDLPDIILRNEYSNLDLVNRKADLDYYFSGKYNGSSFHFTFDKVHEGADEQLRNYLNRFLEILDEIR